MWTIGRGGGCKTSSRSLYRLAKTLSEPEGSSWLQCAALTGCFQAAREDLTSRTLKLDVCSATNNSNNKYKHKLLDKHLHLLRDDGMGGLRLSELLAKTITKTTQRHDCRAEHRSRTGFGGLTRASIAETKTKATNIFVRNTELNLSEHTRHRAEHLPTAGLGNSVLVSIKTITIYDQCFRETELSQGEHNESKERAPYPKKVEHTLTVKTNILSVRTYVQRRAGLGVWLFVCTQQNIASYSIRAIALLITQLSRPYGSSVFCRSSSSSGGSHCCSSSSDNGSSSSCRSIHECLRPSSKIVNIEIRPVFPAGKYAANKAFMKYRAAKNRNKQMHLRKLAVRLCFYVNNEYFSVIPECIKAVGKV